MRPRRLGGIAAALVLGVAGLLVAPAEVGAGGPGGPSCAARKASVLDMTGWAVVRAAWWFEASVQDPARLGQRQAAITRQRVERQHDRARAVCPDRRLDAQTRFVEATRALTGGPMEQPEVEELLAAFDRYDTVETGYVEDLRRCQELLTGVRATYEIHYSGPKRYGKDGWVILALENATDRDRYVTLGGWMVAVRPLPGQGGRYSERHRGRVYGWGGSSSDLMLATAHATTEAYAAPSWYRLRLHEDGAISSVHPAMLVDFGRHTCSAPVRPAEPG